MVARGRGVVHGPGASAFFFFFFKDSVIYSFIFFLFILFSSPKDMLVDWRERGRAEGGRERERDKDRETETEREAEALTGCSRSRAGIRGSRLFSPPDDTSTH